MTSFNRSPDDRQRKPGPRPFIGGSSAPTSRVLRPLATARRNTAAPFAAIPKELSIGEAPPSEEPSVAVLSTPLAGLEAFTHAPEAPEATPQAANQSLASALTINDNTHGAGLEARHRRK